MVRALSVGLQHSEVTCCSLVEKLLQRHCCFSLKDSQALRDETYTASPDLQLGELTQCMPCRFSIEAWGALGEAASLLPKGAQVHVTGRLSTSEYVNKEGRTIQTTFVNVNQINRVDAVREHGLKTYHS